MGYAEKRARKAVKATRGEGLVDALDWLEAKKVEAEIDVSFRTLDLPLRRLMRWEHVLQKAVDFARGPSIEHSKGRSSSKAMP
jgi:hypothetical protein